jgi:hypothetical protein
MATSSISSIDSSAKNKMTSRNLPVFGPLPIRIMAGIAFIVAGLPKLQNISAIDVTQACKA